MLGIARHFAARFRVTLTARRCKHDVVRGHLRPISLMQVLAYMDGVRVISCMPFDRGGRVIGSP